MDLDGVTEELYELRPSEFTAARNERTAAARKSGDRELAEQIQGLRRPTLSAWASNLLAHHRPEEVQSLIRLGEGLRQAHQSLDGDQLRELGRQQHTLVGALAREAQQLTAAAGQKISEDVLYEVEATLHAVLADPQAAQEWAAGHLTKPLSPPVGFTAVVLPTTPHRPPPSATPATARRVGRPSGDKAEAEAAARAGEERRRKLDQARQEAKAAEQQARALEEERGQAESDQERAEELLRQTQERVSALTQELREAQDQQRAVRSEAGEARDRAREAGRAARTARRTAQAAADRAERLARENG